MKCTADRYNGVIIDNSTIPHTLDEFEKNIIQIISDLKDKKILWITLPIAKSDYIPLLIQYNFIFYDCNESSITLLKKLVDNPSTPTPTNHTVGVGAFVMDKNELLVVKDRIYKKYKLPGGYVDHKENISQALVREVFEETGVNVQADSVVSIGHFSPGQFGESNVYIVCKAQPLSREINIIDDHEIIEAQWIDIDEYLHCEDVHIYNKKIVATALKNGGMKLEVNDLFFKNIHHELFF
ncbi:MAG: NUDIX domain-containing protein [Candidatus Electrothrix sp. AR3]|nr:NUDIX domain-containing protein [Candidatus Electrothrix sp. AR3]